MLNSLTQTAPVEPDDCFKAAYITAIEMMSDKMNAVDSIQNVFECTDNGEITAKA